MKIRVLMCEVGKECEVKEIESGLESLQAIVGGLIECYPIGENLDLVLNEEGKMMQLPWNRPLFDQDGKVFDLVAGPCFLIRADNEGGFISVTDEDVQKYRSLLRPVRDSDYRQAMGR